MAERIHRSKQGSDKSTEHPHEESSTSEQGNKLRHELDDLLDEIDEVLESNAEDFVKSYVQKGGE